MLFFSIKKGQRRGNKTEWTYLLVVSEIQQRNDTTLNIKKKMISGHSDWLLSKCLLQFTYQLDHCFSNYKLLCYTFYFISSSTSAYYKDRRSIDVLISPSFSFFSFSFLIPSSFFRGTTSFQFTKNVNDIKRLLMRAPVMKSLHSAFEIIQYFSGGKTKHDSPLLPIQLISLLPLTVHLFIVVFRNITK